MDIPITALSPPISPPTDRVRQAAPQPVQEGLAGGSELIARHNRETREGRDPLRPSRETQADRSTLEARIKFEYEQAHRVMKLHDSKGVLIYQIPPQGALQLILQEEARSSQLQDRA